MRNFHVPDHFYLSFLECLLSGKRHVIAIGDEFGLTGIQAITLLIVDEHEPRPMKSFCLLYHCDASNVTGIVDGLEQKGLVERQSDPKDRRVKTIRLLPAGKKMQQQIIDRLQTDNSYMFDPLTDAEAQQLIHIIDKIAGAKKISLK